MTSKLLSRRGLCVLVTVALAGALGAQDSGTAEKLLPLLKDTDATVRLSTVRTLGELGKSDYATALLPLLEDEDGRVRWAVAGALQNLRGKFLEKDVTALLRNPRGAVRADAVFCLTLIGSGAVLSNLRELWEDPDPRVRAATAVALGQLSKGEFARDVSALLGDRDARVRWVALGTLRKLKSTAFDREVAKLISDRDPLLRWSAWTTLHAFGAKGWISSEIETQIGDRDPGVRGDAVLAAALFNLPSFSAKAGELLRDPEARVRWAAVLALERFRAVAFVSDVQKLLEDPDRDVRRLAAQALPTLEGKKSDKGESLLEERNSVSRLGPSTVFVHGGYARQATAALDALEPSAHWSLALSLGRTPGRAGVDDLESLFDHASPEVRRSAIWILEGWESPSAIGVLKRAADRERDPLALSALREALERAGKKGSNR